MPYQTISLTDFNELLADTYTHLIAHQGISTVTGFHCGGLVQTAVTVGGPMAQCKKCGDVWGTNASCGVVALLGFTLDGQGQKILRIGVAPASKAMAVAPATPAFGTTTRPATQQEYEAFVTSTLIRLYHVRTRLGASHPCGGRIKLPGPGARNSQNPLWPVSVSCGCRCGWGIKDITPWTRFDVEVDANNVPVLDSMSLPPAAVFIKIDPNATPPLDPSYYKKDKPRPAPPKIYSLCSSCRKEVSPTLDAYYGKNPDFASMCSDCRPRE